MKNLKKSLGGGGGKGECERRFEVFVKMQKIGGGGGRGRGVDVNEEVKFLWKFKKKIGRGRWGCRVGGGQGGCERRIEFFVKIKKKIGRGCRERGGSGLGVRVDVNEELKFVF